MLIFLVLNDSIYLNRLHCTWLVNSWAHFYGSKPFDKNIKPTDSFTVAFFSFGEGEFGGNGEFWWINSFCDCLGWHNYHHVFPYDYKTSEHGTYWFNFTTAFIDFMAKLGKKSYYFWSEPERHRKFALKKSPFRIF